MGRRLTEANLRNDTAALDEVARLLDELRSAWLQVAASPRAGERPAATVP